MLFVLYIAVDIFTPPANSGCCEHVTNIVKSTTHFVFGKYCGPNS